MKCDELKWKWAYFPYLDAPEKQHESAVNAGYVKVLLKYEVDESIAELNSSIDKLVGVKKSAEQILQNLLDCGLIKEWYFNGKFNAVLNANDPHLQIAELNAEIDRKDGVLQRWFARCKEARAENIKLKRSLWLARVWMARIKYQMFCFSDHIGDLMNIHGFIQRFKGCSNMRNAKEWQKIWKKVECKCRAKAEEYK